MTWRSWISSDPFVEYNEFAREDGDPTLARQAALAVLATRVPGRPGWPAAGLAPLDKQSGRLYNESVLDPAVHGPGVAIEWFAAAPGKAGNQRSVMVAYLADPKAANGYLGKIDLQGLKPLQGEEVVCQIKDIIPEGRHLGFGKKGGHRTFALENADENRADAITSQLLRELEEGGYRIGSTNLDPSEIKFIGEAHYDRIIRSGPAGWQPAQP